MKYVAIRVRVDMVVFARFASYDKCYFAAEYVNNNFYVKFIKKKKIAYGLHASPYNCFVLLVVNLKLSRELYTFQCTCNVYCLFVVLSILK